jgi:2-keto-3-deoxy-L-rhamnonate aldolase RhmA
MTHPPNKLSTSVSQNELCTAFGIKISPNAQVVQIARNAGFKSLFIDLEHGWLTLAEASNLCNVGNLFGITPFVRIPYECGTGFVQRVLDGGAMGVIFPHVNGAGMSHISLRVDIEVFSRVLMDNVEDARKAVKMCKYPPVGTRSMTGLLPLFGIKAVPLDEMISSSNESGSTVFAMIESREAVEAVGEIAAVEGVDVLLVGSLDLSVDCGVGGQFDNLTFRYLMETVANACKNHGKVFGVAGISDNSETQEWLVNTLGARFMLAQMDLTLIAAGARRTIAAIPDIRSVT